MTENAYYTAEIFKKYDYQVNGDFIFSAEKLLPTADHLHKTSLALKKYLGLLAVKFY